MFFFSRSLAVLMQDFSSISTLRSQMRYNNSIAMPLAFFSTLTLSLSLFILDIIKCLHKLLHEYHAKNSCENVRYAYWNHDVYKTEPET